MKLTVSNGHTTVPVGIYFIGPDDKSHKKKKIPTEVRERAKKRGSRCLVYVTADLAKGAVLFGTAYCCPDDDPLLGTGVVLACANLAIAAEKLGYRLTA